MGNLCASRANVTAHKTNTASSPSPHPREKTLPTSVDISADIINSHTFDSNHKASHPQSIDATIQLSSVEHHDSYVILKGMEPLHEDMIMTKQNSDIRLPEYSVTEVAKHDSIQTAIWIIIGHFVYDITAFIEKRIHPSSIAFIVPYYGQDATEAFESVYHSESATKLLKLYEIGKVKDSGSTMKRAISMRPNLKRTSTQSHISVSKLYIYPVKGCKGLSVQRVELTSSGFVDDRIYAVVNKGTLKAVNQLTYPRLSLIHVAFKSGTDNCDEGVQLNGQFVTFVKEKTIKVEWKSCTSKILVYDQGETVSKWITSFLNDDESNYGDEFILVRIHEDNYRESEEFFALPFSLKESQRMSAFQNYCPVLISSEESLTELNRRYKAREHTEDEGGKVHCDRFRENVIISGVPMANYEDFMKHIVFGDEDFMENKPAEVLWSRRRYFCAVPNVNQNKGINTSEPLATARRYRNAITLNDRTSLPGDDAVFFGSFYGVKHSGVIEVGQEVISEHTKLGFDDVRTSSGMSWYNLTEKNLGSQLLLDYHTLYEDFELIQKEQYNHDTLSLRFKMMVKAQYVIRKSVKESLKMGDHYLLKYSDDDGNVVIRPYTPIFSDNSDDMSFSLLVKVYRKGKMSQHLNNMNIGDKILCKRNDGKLCYFEIGKLRFGDPRFTMFLPYTLNVKQINLIAGGSGITPIYQIINNIHLNKQFDATKISFIYANRSIEDVLLKDKLDEITKMNENIEIHFVLGKLDETLEDIDVGRITMDICKKYLFPPNGKDKDVATLLCGPPPMEDAVKRFLAQIGHDEKSVATF